MQIDPNTPHELGMGENRGKWEKERRKRALHRELHSGPFKDGVSRANE